MGAVAEDRRARRGIVPALLTWYRRERRDLPWRRNPTPYRVWVSEVMLQQTTVRAVIPYYVRFLRSFPSLRALARARQEAVLAAWSGLGYYRRARDLHRAAGLVVRSHGGRFPRSLEEAMSLPGIGRYTAGAILSIARGMPLPVVDGNVARVLSRLFLLDGPPGAGRDKEIWRLSGDLVAASGSPGDLNQALMELGATVCAPRAPECPACPLTRRCRARAAGVQERVPPPRTSRSPVIVRSDLAVVMRNGRLLLRRRQDTPLMRGLWELPMISRDGPADGLRLALGDPVATIRHAITFRRLEIAVRPARLLSEPPRPRYRWVSRASLSRLPTSSLVRKALAAIDSVPRARGFRGRIAPV